MGSTGRTFVNQSVSFPPRLLAKAKARAHNLGLGFSSYVRKCIERDLAERGAIVFSEVEEGGLAAAAAEEERSSGPSGAQAGRRKGGG